MKPSLSPAWPATPLTRRQALATLGALAVPLALGLPACTTHRVSRPESAQRILFVGDSISYAGTWVGWVETWFRLHHPQAATEFINLGLPSETVSGLSEAGHAGGAFPRPDLHERLGRALKQIQPDLVVACYGMNDGIYFPYSDERAAKHYDGLQRLHTAAVQSGARIIHLTPPVFDPVPIRARTLPAGLDAYPNPYVGYDEVLARYGDWLLAKGREGWEVADIHGPMQAHIEAQRRTDPNFTLSGDGVHPGPVGHWLMSRALLGHWGADRTLLEAQSADRLLASHPRGKEIAEQVQQRQNRLRDAWLTAVGHQRPGIGAGRPLPEAQADASQRLEAIRALIRGA